MTVGLCAPGQHVGENEEGRCSSCGDRLEGRSFALAGCLLALVSVAALALLALAVWWLATKPAVM